MGWLQATLLHMLTAFAVLLNGQFAVAISDHEYGLTDMTKCGGLQRVVTETNVPFCFNEPTTEMSQSVFTYRVLSKFLPTKDDYVVLDVGAAYGWYSIFWAKLGFRAIAFEAGDPQFITKHVEINELTDRITVNNIGLGVVGNHGSGAAVDGKQFLTLHDPFVAVTDVLKEFKNKEIAIMKLDIEGSEVETLRAMLKMHSKTDFKIHNIIVEVTPKWWPESAAGLQTFRELIHHNWTFFSSPWSEHAARVQRPPYGVHPVGYQFDWDKEPLCFVQRVPPEQVIDYIKSIKYQRDFLIQSPHTPFPLDMEAEGIVDIQCPLDADTWKYKTMPSYLSDPRNIHDCLDLYHKKPADVNHIKWDTGR